MITSIKETMDAVYEGMVLGTPILQETVIASELVYFGKAVSLAATDDIAETAPQVALFTENETFFGVAIGEPTLTALPHPTTGLANGAPFGAHAANHGMTIVRKGKIWVVSDTDVTSRALGAYVRDEDSLGTPASVVSTTATIANLAGDSFTITVAGYAAQTIAFVGAPASLAAAASVINSQLVGAVAQVSGSQILVTSKEVGSTITIAATDVGTDLVWDTPVAGTGNVATLAWNARGSFRAYTTGQTVAGFTELSNVKWRTGKTVGAKYYGLLEVGL